MSPTYGEGAFPFCFRTPKRPVDASALNGSEYPGEGGDLSEVSACSLGSSMRATIWMGIPRRICSHSSNSRQACGLTDRILSMFSGR